MAPRHLRSDVDVESFVCHGDGKKKGYFGSCEAHLGNIFRKAYEDVASLGDSERNAALKLAEKCVNDFAVFDACPFDALVLIFGCRVERRFDSQ